MKKSIVSGFVAAAFAVVAVVAAGSDAIQAESICTSAICFAICALCLFFIYRDVEFMHECDEDEK